MASQSLLLALPLEIRHCIYAHLCRTEPISYPWMFSPISSIDIRPPPLALQLTCRLLFSEIQSYYYGRATLRFVNPAIQPPFSREHGVSCGKAIRLAKKVEIMLVWNITAQQTMNEYQSWSMHIFLPGIVELLLEHEENLGLVILSLKDACEKEVDWSFKRKLLAPLADLPRKLRLVVGEVTAACEEEETLRQHLQDHVNEQNAQALVVKKNSNED